MFNFSFGKKNTDTTNAPPANTREKPVKTTKNWYADRYQSMLVQRNLFSAIALIALSGIAIASFALMTIVQSKTIEPFVIEVEEKTGIATVVDQLSVKQYTANETIVQYFIVQYLRAREGYDFTTFEHDYFNIVRLLSTGEVYNSFRKTVAQSNPESPIVKLGANLRREIKIKSIQFLSSDNNTNTAQIRFKRTDIRKKGNGIQSVEHKIALLSFDFIQLNLNMEDRYINPLGFQVTNYRVDDEAIIQ